MPVSKPLDREGLPREVSRAQGFTLIELIVVITILGILATMVVVSVSGRTEQTKATRVRSDFKAIENAAQAFKIDHGRFPDSLEELVNPPEMPSGMPSNEYLDRMPKDPFSGQPYEYDIVDRKVYLISYGADGQEGGEEWDADIDNRDDEDY